tara:strand:- start:73 stop:297 length:225 start_codon:yes stop_codon:yes gene_type:complete
MPEGVGYPSKTKRKRQTKLTNDSKPLTPKEIEKEFQGKHQVENPKAKTKISSVSKKKERKDRKAAFEKRKRDRK